jgi:hypothetical protein
MGFMDKFKDVAQQAQEGIDKVTPNPGDTGYAQAANRLAKSGVACTAEVRSAAATGKQDMGNPQYAIEVHVEGNGDPYDATVIQYVPEGSASMYAPGTRWQAKADPNDRTTLLLYGQA